MNEWEINLSNFFDNNNIENLLKKKNNFNSLKEYCKEFCSFIEQYGFSSQIKIDDINFKIEINIITDPLLKISFKMYCTFKDNLILLEYTSDATIDRQIEFQYKTINEQLNDINNKDEILLAFSNYFINFLNKLKKRGLLVPYNLAKP
jgi:hypothetical protein